MMNVHSLPVKAGETSRGAPAPAGSLAMLKNVASCLVLVETLRGRGHHLPGIGVLHGPSGYGKTYAAIYAQNKTRALRVEVGDSWTRKTLLRYVLAEAGLPAKGTIADLAEQVIYALGDDPERPLIIDEADKLVDKGMIELIREISEKSGAPILLIGEEQLPAKLARHERVHNRVLDWCPAQPCDGDDTAALARMFCSGLELAPDLLEAVRTRTHGRARRIVTTLSAIAEHARNIGASALDLAGYQGPWSTGTVPPVRDAK